MNYILLLHKEKQTIDTILTVMIKYTDYHFKTEDK